MINLRRFFLDQKNLALLNSRGENFSQTVAELSQLLTFKKELLFFLENRQRIVNLTNVKGKTGYSASSLAYQQLLFNKKLIKHCQKLLAFLENDLLQLTSLLPNLPASNSPVGNESKANLIVKTVDFNHPQISGLDHWTIAQKLGWVENLQAVHLAKSRFVIYLQEGALLVRVLQNFMLDYHLQKDYQELVVPYLVKQAALWGTGQFPKMKNDCFQLVGHDLFLLPTAETALINFCQKKLFKREELPYKLCAYSPCFRQEAGAAGKETKGLVRLHQFHKVEIVQITLAEQSDQTLETMVREVAQILNLLQIPYRIVELCRGELSHAASKAYDLEIWIPSQKKYLEVASLSNTTDFQAQTLQIKYLLKDDKKKQLAHTLNGSGLAIDRLIIALLEYYYDQKTNKFQWPAILQPYLFAHKKK